MPSEMLYQQIYKYLLQLIRENQSKADYRLPSENQLSIKFHASRISVQRAFHMLEEEDLIYRQQGRGTFIRRQSEAPVNTSLEQSVVGMLVPCFDSSYIQKIITSAQEHLEKHNMALAVFSTCDSVRLEKDLISTVLKLHAKGLIVMPVCFNRYSDEMLQLALSKFPTVQIDRHLPGLPISTVSCDHFHSAYNVTALLQSQGHTVIGLISQPLAYCSAVSTRLTGYERAMLDADILYNSQVLFCKDIVDPDYEDAFETFLDTVRPTALICFARYYGAHISKVFTKRGIRMMQDITVAVYDNEFIDMFAYTDTMPIIIDQRPEEIGKSAAEELLRLIAGKSTGSEILIPEQIYPSRPIPR